MKLIIYNCDDIKFINYIINFLKLYILLEINYRKLSKIEAQLNAILELVDPTYKLHIYCYTIIQTAANSLRYKRFQDRVEISIDDTKKINGTDAKLCDICKLINYGNMSVNGYPIFTEAFNYISDNMDLLYYNYYVR